MIDVIIKYIKYGNAERVERLIGTLTAKEVTLLYERIKAEGLEAYLIGLRSR